MEKARPIRHAGTLADPELLGREDTLTSQERADFLADIREEEGLKFQSVPLEDYEILPDPEAGLEN